MLEIPLCLATYRADFLSASISLCPIKGIRGALVGYGEGCNMGTRIWEELRKLALTGSIVLLRQLCSLESVLCGSVEPRVEQQGRGAHVVNPSGELPRTTFFHLFFFRNGMWRVCTRVQLSVACSMEGLARAPQVGHWCALVQRLARGQDAEWGSSFQDRPWTIGAYSSAAKPFEEVGAAVTAASD
eukprot:g46662.t1